MAGDTEGAIKAALLGVLGAIETGVRRGEAAYLRKCAVEAAAREAVHASRQREPILQAHEKLLANAAAVSGRAQSAPSLQTSLAAAGRSDLSKRVAKLHKARCVAAHPDTELQRQVCVALAKGVGADVIGSGQSEGDHVASTTTEPVEPESSVGSAVLGDQVSEGRHVVEGGYDTPDVHAGEEPGAVQVGICGSEGIGVQDLVKESQSVSGGQECKGGALGCRQREAIARMEALMPQLGPVRREGLQGIMASVAGDVQDEEVVEDCPVADLERWQVQSCHKKKKGGKDGWKYWRRGYWSG